MYRLLTLLICVFALVGCEKTSNTESATRFHDDGRAKPMVLVQPVIDSTNYDLPWSLSDEFTALIRSQLSTKDSIFLPSDPVSHCAFSKDPFSSDISWMKDAFSSNEFVVFTELVQHEQIPGKKSLIPSKAASNNLQTAIRLRIVDLRGSTPKIILQEIVKDSYFISKTLLPVNYNVSSWGKEEYETSPMSIAHIRITKELVDHAYEYISLAQSR